MNLMLRESIFDIKWQKRNIRKNVLRLNYDFEYDTVIHLLRQYDLTPIQAGDSTIYSRPPSLNSKPSKDAHTGF